MHDEDDKPGQMTFSIAEILLLITGMNDTVTLTTARTASTIAYVEDAKTLKRRLTLELRSLQVAGGLEIIPAI